MNSEVLLEKTNLTLFVINEYTLTKWYKNRVRREEVTSLLQGITLPSCATSSVTTPDLPPAKEPPSSPPPPPETPHVFVEPEDTSGQPMSSPDHTQFRGKRYCPCLFPEKTKEQWLEERRAEFRAKKTT